MPLPASRVSLGRPWALKVSSTRETALRVVRWEWSMLDSGVGVPEPSNLCAGLRQKALMTAEQGRRPGSTEQSGADPVEPALPLAAAQIPRRAMGTQAVGQLA